MFSHRAFIAALALILAGLAPQAEARHHPAAAAAETYSTEAATYPSGVFDYYVLALSWSPTYCLTHPADTAECSKGYGFVLHGLWPQFTRGGWPQDCYTVERLTPEAVAFGNTIFPNASLIDHEWSKHGSCSGLSSLAYFQTADRARTAVKIPAALDAPSKTHSMTAADIDKAFIAANPGLTAKGIAVGCSGPELAQVTVCMSRDLEFMPCGKGVTNSCRKGPLRIPASR
jgi:ribonuclease T2